MEKITLIITIILLLTFSYSETIPNSIEGIKLSDCNLSKNLVFDSPEFVYGANGGNYYTYAPSIILDSGIEQIWTCHNFISGTIIDNIGYSTPNQSLGKSIIAPGNENEWDSFHTCDPSIVYGPFTYQGKNYDYALYYLGFDLAQIKKNQIGIAFSNSIDNGGTWTKSSTNPLIPYQDPIQGNSWWGVGQPSAVNVNGIIWVFYTVGDSYGTKVKYKTFDPTNPFTSLSSGVVTTNGLKNIQGDDDWLNNADFAYIPDKNSFLIIKDKHYNNTQISINSPTFITNALEISIIKKNDIDNGIWTVIGTIDQSISNFPKNHNAGIIRNKLGEVFLPYLDFIFTVSCSEASCGNKLPEWSYDLYKIRGVSSCNPTEICNSVDDDSDGSTDEGCDDDQDTYADSTMICPKNKSFYTWQYKQEYATRFPNQGSTFYNDPQLGWLWSQGDGWVWISFPCTTNSGDIDDSNPNIHPGATQTNPICNQFTQRYSLTQLNSEINNWRNGNQTLLNLLKKTKLWKYCN